jgi:long-chain acyl-CoA synthetase
MNTLMLLQMASEAMGDRIAITNNGESLTYQKLYQTALAAAKVIDDSNCQFVSVLDTSSFAVPIAMFGAAAAGIPYVPINYRLTGNEIDQLLARVKPVLLITDKDKAQRFGRNDGVTVIGRDAFIKHSTDTQVEDNGFPMDPDQIAVQLFTSGTTGQPKAAVLRHNNLVSYILGSVEFASADEGDAAIVTVPPYHVAGISALISSVYSGRRMVLLPDFTSEAWLELVTREKISNAFVVPTMLTRIIDHLVAQGVEEVDMPSLNALAYGGGKMPLRVIEAALKLFPNVRFTNAYGLTETSSTITILGSDEHREAVTSADPAIHKRLSSVGIPLPAVEIEIRDPDGKIMPADEAGEIYVRGEQVSGEYVGKGSTLDSKGWFPTRDTGHLDAAGYLYLDGRADDVIVRGGENISPGEIEDLLLSRDDLLDVAVVGIPSDQWGEAVSAAIVKKPDAQVSAEELKAFVRVELRSSRVPEKIEFVDELPYNETGKLLRRQVKLELAEN